MTVYMYSTPHKTIPSDQVTRSEYGRTRRLSHFIGTALGGGPHVNGGGPHVNGSHRRVIQVCTMQIDEVDEVNAVRVIVGRSQSVTSG